MKNKKPPNLPRLNSFKKSSSPRTSRMNSRDDSTASQHQNHSPSSYQNHVTQGSESRTYDAVPPPKLASVHGPSNQGLTDSFDSRTTYDALPPPTSASLHRTSDQGSVETVSSGMTYDALPPPNAASLRRTSNQGSTDTVNSGMTYDALPPPKPTAVHVLPKPPPGLASQIAKQVRICMYQNEYVYRFRSMCEVCAKAKGVLSACEIHPNYQSHSLYTQGCAVPLSHTQSSLTRLNVSASCGGRCLN